MAFGRKLGLEGLKGFLLNIEISFFPVCGNGVGSATQLGRFNRTWGSYRNFVSIALPLVTCRFTFDCNEAVRFRSSITVLVTHIVNDA